MSIELSRISRREFLVLGAAGASALVLRENVLKTNQQKQVVGIVPSSSASTPEPTNTLEPTPTSTPKPPEKPILSPEMQRLQDKLNTEIENYQGQTAIGITDCLTGESINVNGNRPQLPGCVANLACALTAVSELSKNKALFAKDDIENDLTVMVRHSNPSVGLRVVEAIGGGSIEKGIGIINDNMKDWGMNKSFYDHPPAYDATYSIHGVPNQMTACEIDSVLSRIATRQLFNNKGFDWNVYTLWVMSNNKVGLNFMIPGEIPESDATVFHKVGWVPGQPNTINDAGVVSASDHRFLYTITFMYQNLETAVSENTLFYEPGFFGRTLSKITYDTFSEKYSL